MTTSNTTDKEASLPVDKSYCDMVLLALKQALLLATETFSMTSGVTDMVKLGFAVEFPYIDYDKLCHLNGSLWEVRDTLRKLVDGLESREIKTPEVRCDECGKVIPDDEVKESEIIGLVDEKIHVCKNCEHKFSDKMNGIDTQSEVKCNCCGEPIPADKVKETELEVNGEMQHICEECFDGMSEPAGSRPQHES